MKNFRKNNVFTSHITHMMKKSFYAISLLVTLLLLAGNVQSQNSNEQPTRFTFKGIETAFGMSSFKISSDIPHLQNSTLVQAGGKVGVVFGNELTRFIIKPLGLYQSVTSNTVNMYSFEAESQTYILSSILKKKSNFDIYGSFGFAYNSNKFFGHYINQDIRPLGKSIWETLPYLGRTDNTFITYGLGLEYQMLCNESFVQFFLDSRSGMSVHSSSNSESFDNTILTKNMEVSAGVRFGLSK